MHRRSLGWALLFLGCAVPALAQEAPRTASEIEKSEKNKKEDARTPGPWELDANLAALFTQSAFSSNWARGDKGTFSWTITGESTAKRQLSRNWNWSNLLRLAYGQTGRQESDPDNPDRNVWQPPDKTTDQILAESTARLTLGGYVDPFFGLRLDSQFLDESFEPLGTLKINPVRLTETAGVARLFRKTEHAELISRLGLGARQTFSRERVAISDGAVETRSFSTNDGGLEWLTTAVQPVTRDNKIVYKGRLLVFAPLFFSKSSDLEEFDRRALAAHPGRDEVGGFWKTPDVDFQNELVFAVTKSVSMNVFVHAVYDKFDASTNVDLSQGIDTLIPIVDRSVRRKAQYKETLALGITYKLF